MRKFFQFFSLTLATQGVLLLNQLALLPLQIRIWGHGITAQWYTMLGIAAIASVADGGLRTAGHAELIRSIANPTDQAAKRVVQHLWAWIRILLASVTLILTGLSLAYRWFYSGVNSPYPFWGIVLIVGITFETIVLIRVMYLDSIELYRQAEVGYLLLATSRLALALVALIFFHSPPEVLAWIWLLCGLLAILHQSTLCRRIGLLRLFEPLPPGLSFQSLKIARYTLADPVSAWMRAYIPVLILAAIARAEAVTIYVALRAVFGTARQVILQLARFASVQYVWLKESHRAVLAETQFTLCVLFAAFFASVLMGIVVADNFRLASFWLVHSDPVLYTQIAITFGLASPLYAYQIMQALMLRHGKVIEIARRQYVYIICLMIFAGLALLTKSILLWLGAILLAEVTIALSFMLRNSAHIPIVAGVRGALAALASALAGMSLWLLIQPFDFLRQLTAEAIPYTLAFLSLWTIALALFYFYLGHDLFKSELKTLVLNALGALWARKANDEMVE